MTNSAINTRTVLASVALLAGVDTTERCGVVLRRTEYTVPGAPALVGNRDLRRVAFVVRLDGGIGSELVTIDQRLDAIAALIQEGDQVSAMLVDSVHVESTVQPIFPWAFSTESNPAGRVLRQGAFLNDKGEECTASLILGDSGCVIAVNGANDDLGASGVTERVGVILKRTVYKNGEHRPASAPLIGTTDKQRVTFMIRLDGGIGSELVTIDQTLDATSVLLKEGDQISVKLVDNVHVESTVHPVFDWTHSSKPVGGRILRLGEFLDKQGRSSIATLVLADGEGRGLVVNEEPCAESPRDREARLRAALA